MTIGIATIEGRENQCAIAFSSLKNQIPNCKFNIFKNDEKGDAAKFNELGNGYFFACDDDLIYPPDYISRMTAKLQEYGNKIIITCMGRILNQQPIKSYYRNGSIQKASCLDLVIRDTFVHIGGSGVMAFHTDYFRPDISEFKNGFMADIWVSLLAQKKKIPILVMAHEKNWIWQQEHTGGIYERFRDNDSEQVKAINSINWQIYETELLRAGEVAQDDATAQHTEPDGQETA